MQLRRCVRRDVTVFYIIQCCVAKINLSHVRVNSRNKKDGAFNPAVYRLVDLWGFSSRIYSNGDFGLPYDRPVTAQQFAENGYPLPEQKYVTAFSQKDFVSFDEQAVELTQQDGKYYVTKNVSPVTVDGVEYQQWLDLGGIAKGYVVDGIKQLLQQPWQHDWIRKSSAEIRGRCIARWISGREKTWRITW